MSAIENLEVKLSVRHVKDAEYWKLPVGTPIVAHPSVDALKNAPVGSRVSDSSDASKSAAMFTKTGPDTWKADGGGMLSTDALHKFVNDPHGPHNPTLAAPKALEGRSTAAGGGASRGEYVRADAMRDLRKDRERSQLADTAFGQHSMSSVPGGGGIYAGMKHGESKVGMSHITDLNNAAREAGNGKLEESEIHDYLQHSLGQKPTFEDMKRAIGGVGHHKVMDRFGRPSSRPEVLKALGVATKGEERPDFANGPGRERLSRADRYKAATERLAAKLESKRA